MAEICLLNPRGFGTANISFMAITTSPDVKPPRRLNGGAGGKH